MAVNKILVTHDASFHADDAFAVAVVRILHGKHLVIKRTRDKDEIAAADIVLDVGGIYDAPTDRFDHHQPGGAGERRNGIPYASFGLVWKKYGAELCANNIDISAMVDAKLVAPIDAWDNGMSLWDPKIEGTHPYTISLTIMALNPSWQEETDFFSSFMRAVSLAEEIVRREIAHSKAAVEARTAIFGAYERSGDRRILSLQEPYPWYDAVKDLPEVQFVIAPRKADGTWSAKAVEGDGEFNFKVHFPVEWAGKEGEAIRAASGVDDALFCHRTAAMAYAKSQAGALAMVRQALKQ